MDGKAGYPDVEMLIGGKWVMADSRPVYDPCSGEVIGERAHAGTDHLDEAVDAARVGMRAWWELGPAGREAVMVKAAALLRERVEEIARIITLEEGKTLREARGEILRAASYIEWDAHEGRRLYGRIVPSTDDYQLAVHRRPVGLVAGFSPWNFPIGSPTRKIGGALAAGCGVILKAAEDTPGAARQLVQAFVDAGIPDGALSLVFGDPPAISEHLLAHPEVRMITFTGSVAVGKHLAALAGAEMKPALMELGGHCPVFVSATADVAAAARSTAMVKTMNAGQVCVSPTRFFVEDAAFDAFADGMVAAAGALRLGSGLDEATEMGPLINRRRLDSISGLVAEAQIVGAKLLAGGAQVDRPGNFYPLTVLADVPDDARIMREEPFGPVALLVRVRDVDEAIERANSVSYGLAGYAFTNSARDMQRLSTRLEVGNLAINHLMASDADLPFGGVKDSGLGREGGAEGPLNHTVVKTVSTLFPDAK
ncbi:MAG: NAD-dependent succinate-semialdehyde dehydrogenase [Novosphingobium sp.]|nr:NAD-dependent succinate-semialdehyde dehydrogenase [Novosphingobium sp.]